MFDKCSKASRLYLSFGAGDFTITKDVQAKSRVGRNIGSTFR